MGKFRFQQTGYKKMETNIIEYPIQRRWITEKSTISEMLLGDEKLFILEDPIRDKKIYGETAIPAGRYRVVGLPSPSKRHIELYLLDVPNYIGIQIHRGNTAADTKGCLLPGLNRLPDYVTQSTDAYLKICNEFCRQWIDAKQTWIDIRNPKA